MRARPSPRRLIVAVALSATVAVLAPVTAPAHAVPLPGGLELTFDQQNVSLFIPYPGMGACRQAYFSNCFRFEDGTVVGQLSPLTLLIPIVNLLGVPWNGCTTVKQLGASPNVVEVYAGSGVPLIVGADDCASLPGQLTSGRAHLVVPGVTKAIPPTVASVLELDVARR